VSRTSTAALTAALTTLTPAAAVAAGHDNAKDTTTPAQNTKAVVAAMKPAIAGHRSVAAQMTREARKLKRHRQLVQRHLKLERTLAHLQATKPPKHGAQHFAGWSNGKLARTNRTLEGRIEDARAAAAQPAPTTASATSTATTPTTTSSSYSSGGGAGGSLATIRSCESNGNYSTNTGNGFYGAYQFTQSSWQSVGGTGNPAAASPAEQDQRAQMLMAQQGSSAWPVCGH